MRPFYETEIQPRRRVIGNWKRKKRKNMDRKKKEKEEFRNGRAHSRLGTPINMKTTTTTTTVPVMLGTGWS